MNFRTNNTVDGGARLSKETRGYLSAGADTANYLLCRLDMHEYIGDA